MTRWLIERPGSGLFLHVFHDDHVAWSGDPTRALRFRSKAEAERFGRNHLTETFAVGAHALAELVQPQAGDLITGEVEDLVDERFETETIAPTGSRFGMMRIA